MYILPIKPQMANLKKLEVCSNILLQLFQLDAKTINRVGANWS